jgi:hypothetical protein
MAGRGGCIDGHGLVAMNPVQLSVFIVFSTNGYASIWKKDDAASWLQKGRKYGRSFKGTERHGSGISVGSVELIHG